MGVAPQGRGSGPSGKARCRDGPRRLSVGTGGFSPHPMVLLDLPVQKEK